MKTNHQRNFKANKDSQRYSGSPMGYNVSYSKFADIVVGASWGGDNANGHKGYAKAKRGGKKYVRTRIRFHENQALKKTSAESDILY